MPTPRVLLRTFLVNRFSEGDSLKRLVEDNFEQITADINWDASTTDRAESIVGTLSDRGLLPQLWPVLMREREAYADEIRTIQAAWANTPATVPIVPTVPQENRAVVVERTSPVATRYDSTIQDLLQVRDVFHPHLSRKQNVIGTAIGRFLIRQSEPWPGTENDPAGRRQLVRALAVPRTLENSEVRSYSQPCVLVFVSRWATDFYDPAQAIERVLELPDGRSFPTCVVLSEARQPGAASPIVLTNGPVGGGYLVVSDSQGLLRAATFGCLVQDDRAIYGLTSLRAIGDDGRPVHAMIDGQSHALGKSSMKHAGGFRFSDVYPGLSDAQASLELDAGLVLLDDAKSVTSQIFGVGAPGPLGSPNVAAAGRGLTSLIGTAVTAFGCASGRLRGRIDGLFYRFRREDGSESMAEVLIGPGSAERTRTSAALPGDAGAVWLMEDPRGVGPPRPMACTISGQRLDAGAAAFTLAASLGTVTTILNISIVGQWNATLPPEWASVRTANDRARNEDGASAPTLARRRSASAAKPMASRKRR